MFIHLILAPNPRSHEAPRRVTAFFNALLADFASAIYWFNPFVKKLRRRYVEESERACDASTIRAGIAPKQYAQSLLELAISQQQPRHVGIFQLGDSGHPLEKRIAQILRGNSYEPTHGLLSGLMTIFAIIVVGCGNSTELKEDVTLDPSPATQAFAEEAILRLAADPFPSLD